MGIAYKGHEGGVHGVRQGCSRYVAWISDGGAPDELTLFAVCIGIHLAHLELRLATARFFLAFPDVTVAAVDGMSDEDMEQVIHFLLAPKGRRCLVHSEIGASEEI